MGYTTKFEGQFDLEPKMDSLSIVDTLEIWSDGEDGPIDGYCQWEVTKDRQHIKWDGNEKFRDYIEWLQYIIDDLLLPNGYILMGSVQYSGEDMSDRGTLLIVDGKVKDIKRVGKETVCPHCGESFMLEGDEA